jgi:hypothetical protein
MLSKHLGKTLGGIFFVFYAANRVEANGAKDLVAGQTVKCFTTKGTKVREVEP